MDEIKRNLHNNSEKEVRGTAAAATVATAVATATAADQLKVMMRIRLFGQLGL